MSTAAPTLTELSGTYTIDPSHSRLGFVARHAMVTKVRGNFNEFEGSFKADGDDPSNSSAQVVIQAASIDTRNEDRDGHLRSNDFFAMDEHPTIRFESTEIERVSETDFKVTGDLTIRGTTKPVTLELEFAGSAVDPWGNTRVGFEGSTQINRKDWGLNWNAALDAGGVLVSEKVTIEVEISATRDA
jgi:polyisoprenoid-binding protein YceI